MFKVYDRGADRGDYRFCIVEAAGRFREGDAVRVVYNRQPHDAHVTRAGRPYGGAHTVQNYYLDLDPAAVGAPLELTGEQAEWREHRRKNPTSQEKAARQEFGRRMAEGKARELELRRSRLRGAISAAGGREAFAAREGVTLAWIRERLGEKP